MFTPEVARGATIEDVTEVPALPAGLPSGLLERRPDIRRSEALLAASDLRIQQARANYFPSLTLTGAYGFESAALIAACSRARAAIWSIGLGLVQPLFALKSIEAQVELATARRDEVAVEYRQTVQIAFREVHDALVANRSARDVLAAETDRRNQIAKAYEVALLRYDAGRTSFLEVIDAQRHAAGGGDAAHRRRARREAVDRRLREVAGRRLEPGAVRRGALTACRSGSRLTRERGEAEAPPCLPRIVLGSGARNGRCRDCSNARPRDDGGERP